MQDFTHDVLIIGGGPAGLTSAIYLVRYHLKIKVIDAGNSRAGWIPCTHNHAGYPDGINGKELLARMREQAQRYGADIDTGRVSRLDVIEGGFQAEFGSGCIRARKVLLATGVTNRRPPMDLVMHDEMMAQGLIRYCPVCDGYEVTDKKIAVIGDDSHGVAEAIFIRGFTEDITLIAPDAEHRLDNQDWSKLEEYGIKTIDGPAQIVGADNGKVIVQTAGGGPVAYDSVYPALGSDVHNDLARQIGCQLADDGTITVDDHQRTSIPGVYAAGDVVLGLDQISHAMGEGGVAATTIRNDLAKERPIIREALRGNSMR